MIKISIKNDILDDLYKRLPERREEIFGDKNARPFENIFQGKQRIAIPLLNDFMKKISNILGNEYELTNDIKYVRKRLPNGELEEKPRKTGSVLNKKLKKYDKEYAEKVMNELARQIEAFNKSDDSEKIIIISRNPIDVLRMSDHENIESCHSPRRDYFHCAIADAIDGALISYVVEKDDIERLKKDDESIQDFINRENEILFDKDRDDDDDDDDDDELISPISRLRICRYKHKNENYDLAIPAGRVYGEKNPDFSDSIINFFRKKQHELLEKNDLLESKVDLSEFARYGGSYQDHDSYTLFLEFLKHKKIKGHPSYEGYNEDYMSEDIIEQNREELEEIFINNNDSLNEINVNAEILEDGTLFTTVDFSLEIPGFSELLQLFKNELIEKIKNIIEKEMYGMFIILDNGIIIRNFREELYVQIQIESEENDPDEVNYIFGELRDFESFNGLQKIKNNIKIYSENNGIIQYDYNKNKNMLYSNFEEIDEMDDLPGWFEIEIKNDLNVYDPFSVSNNYSEKLNFELDKILQNHSKKIEDFLNYNDLIIFKNFNKSKNRFNLLFMVDAINSSEEEMEKMIKIINDFNNNLPKEKIKEIIINHTRNFANDQIVNFIVNYPFRYNEVLKEYEFIINNKKHEIYDRYIKKIKHELQKFGHTHVFNSILISMIRDMEHNPIYKRAAKDAINEFISESQGLLQEISDDAKESIKEIQAKNNWYKISISKKEWLNIRKQNGWTKKYQENETKHKPIKITK